MKKLFFIIFLVIPAFLLGCNFDNNEKTFSEKTENEPVTSEKTEKEPVTIEIKNQPVYHGRKKINFCRIKIRGRNKWRKSYISMV